MPSTTPITDMLTGIIWTIIITGLLIGWGIFLKKDKTVYSKYIWVYGALGVCIYTIIGSWLDMLRLAYNPTLVLLVLIGGIGWFRINFTALPKIRLSTYQSLSLTAVGIVTLVIVGIGSNHWTFNVNWDDSSGYWPVCQQMMVKGTSEGIYSLRRALSLGGQYPLQTLGMLYTQEMGGFIYDMGVGALLCAAYSLNLIWGKEKQKVTNVFLATFLVLLPQTAWNSAPAVLLCLLFLAAYNLRTSPIYLGLLLGTLILMRTQAIIPAFLLGCLALYEVYRENGIKMSLKFGIAVPTITLLVLIPGFINSYNQFGTPWVFINPGSVNPDYINFINHGKHAISNLSSLLLNCSIMIGVLTGCIYLNLGRKLASISLLSLLGIYLSMPEYSFIEWGRYTWPFYSAALYQASKDLQNRKLDLTGILVVLLYLSSASPISILLSRVDKSVKSIESSANGTFKWQIPSLVQYSLPEKAGILVISRQPNLFDYSRNNIQVWDSFPAVGDMPSTGKKEEWTEWGQKNNIDYIIHEGWDENGLFSEEMGRIITVEELWTGTGFPFNLPHYQRVWWDDRARGISILKDLAKNTESYKDLTYTIIPISKKEQ